MKDVRSWLQRLSKILRTLWLLFPSVLFLLLIWQCFWILPQGKDIIISLLEKRIAPGLLLIALLFLVLITWYTGRILVYRKKSLSADLYAFYSTNKTNPDPQTVPNYLLVFFNIPRLLGFLIFSLTWLAMLQLEPLPHIGFHASLSATWAYILLLASMGLYVLLYRLARKIRDEKIEQDKGKAIATSTLKKRKRGILLTYFVLLFLLAALNMLLHNAWLLIGSIMLMQILFPFIVVIRRNTSDLSTLPLMESGGYGYWLKKEQLSANPLHFIMYHANIPIAEKSFFKWFNAIALIGSVIYFISIFSFSSSVFIGSFSFVLLAFGVLIGFLAIVSILSVANEINLHIFIFVLMILIGMIPGFEPHNVQLQSAASTNPLPYRSRPTLHSYFENWVKERRSQIDSATVYPVYFVLSDGGASRSGYWTAAALGNLEDRSQGKFSSHLFCLSGASGGSVGNGSFYSLLYQRSKGQAVDGFQENGKTYLKEDFLTYTLGRMLGPDVLRFLLPIWFIDDRAAALEQALEKGGPENNAIAKTMGMEMHDLLPLHNSRLPILCINVTRMQDGNPGVISSISLDKNSFGKRLDVLQTLDTGITMKLSTAVIMGARFPYISPAGRINNSYYVDGGYFDNSGAGVVHEMMIELQRRIRDSLAVNPQHYFRKLQFTVVHVMNSPEGNPVIEKVHPLKNDLMAPALTMLGSYSTQTTVNNLRLVKYLEDLTKRKDRYIKINLYEQRPWIDFPMNWTISDFYREKMDARIQTNMGLLKLHQELNGLKN